MHTLLPVTIVTLSAAPGIPLGAQFPAVFHAVDTDPFQVYDVWDFAACAQINTAMNSRSLFIDTLSIVFRMN
jgi:hypothetical protein